MARHGLKLRGTDFNFDSEFSFLLQINPALEDWRRLAAEWWSSQGPCRGKRAALTTFFVEYMIPLELETRPIALFEIGSALPDLWSTLKLETLTRSEGKRRHDIISDFISWVLRTKLTEPDDYGHLVVPHHLHHPFPRLNPKVACKTSDIGFNHIVERDPRMCRWQELASEWLRAQKRAVSDRRYALDKFMSDYIIGYALPYQPIEFLKRNTQKPVFSEILISKKTKGTVGALAIADVKINNYVSDFLDWLLAEKLSIDNGHGRRDVLPDLHNPVKRMSRSGISIPTETVRSALSIRYIKELRTLLAEGPNFKDWEWAQEVMDGSNRGGDWFIVSPETIFHDDPDCVWRKRDSSAYERSALKYPPQVIELWSPVRAMALFLKLELPLRSFQIRMLDSGEADTWYYVHAVEGGSFELNKSSLANGDVARPCQRGVFHRHTNESGTGLFINTNKSADINKPENSKGYVIPWAHETALYWLDKLRNWQQRYNPIDAPTPWISLEAKHFGHTPPHPEILESRGEACFLFRDASAKGNDRQKPLIRNSLDRIWYQLLARLEQRCLARNETLDDGSPIQFVDHNSASRTHYPLHALRVSLISYLVLDLQLPLEVVSKLIAGHTRLIMTLYYVKFGHAHMKEVLEKAERNTLAADESSHRRFLMDATMDDVCQRFASISGDAMQAAIGHKSAATFVFEDKGICPVGGAMCDVGGEAIKGRPSEQLYLPVPGYPERNCVRCRFFLSGPAFLPGLQAHFNAISYEAHERSERHNTLKDRVAALENRRLDCQRDGLFFSETRELESLSQRYEAEAEALGKLVNDWQATHHLIMRSMEILKEVKKDEMQIVAVGEMHDIQIGFAETASEMYQLEVICENATIYPEIDARKPTLRRSQILDCMLELNKMTPILFRLTPEQQLSVGNAVMHLIQARTGSLKGAVDYIEGNRRLRDLGIVDETWEVLSESLSGTSALEVINAARIKRELLNP